MRLRFAPSPTGQLHIGNARTALFNWLLARGQGGALVLRVEDTDLERSTPESEAAILEDLRWLGLDWDEGPDVGGPYGPYRQSERLPLYRSHAERLLEMGRAYYCFCPPQRLEADRQAALASGRVPRYAGTCRSIPPDQAQRRAAAGERAVVRFRVPAGERVRFQDLIRGEVTFSTEVIGDPVLLRSDGHPAYNFAVVVDDALMRITQVVRGEDHISNTPRQVLLYDALGFEPPRFAHLALVLGPDHTPLSKRHGATSVAEFRARGYLAEALVNYLALIGWSPGHDEELLSVPELVRRFSLDHVTHSAGVFDPEKLAWINRHSMKDANPERLVSEVLPYFERLAYVRASTADARSFIASLLPMAAGLVDRLEQIPERLQFVFDYNAQAALTQPEVGDVLHEPGAIDVVRVLSGELARAPRLLDRGAFRSAAARVGAQTGCKGRALFHPIRIALTGGAGGPELDLAVPAIDRGADLPASAGVAPILGCRERAASFAAAIDGRA